jgi:galactokinase
VPVLLELRHLSRTANKGAILSKISSTAVAENFRREFGARPEIFRAPGRVNLIGEHTDYNEGFVLPSAIGFYVRAAISPRSDRKLLLRSAEFQTKFEIDLDALPTHKLFAWCDYVAGVAVMLANAGCYLKGADLLIDSEVPIGAGLSSSAALEVASALALLSLIPVKLSLQQIAKLSQKAENDFVGARVGIMDQFVSCFGREGHAILLDCRTLDFQLVPIPHTVKLVICNTNVKHELSAGEYNRRREECEDAIKFLSQTYPEIHSLRDVSLPQLSAVRGQMAPVLYKRAAHVISENDRVLRAAKCFQKSDLSGAGELMRQSHRSLRDDYEVSCRELDLMVDAAEGMPGYYGGRMTGGGFGGCTVNLVEASQASGFAETIAERYRRAANISPQVFICSPANGAVAGWNKAAS